MEQISEQTVHSCYALYPLRKGRSNKVVQQYNELCVLQGVQGFGDTIRTQNKFTFSFDIDILAG